jgi:hypothetical protein
MTNFRELGEHNINRLAVSMVYDKLPGTGISNKIKATDILGQNTPYDILWDDNKLCVRIANCSTTSRFPKWNYTLKAENRKMVDFYIFLAVKSDEIFKVFVLPPDIIPETTVTIAERFGEVRYSQFVTTLDEVAKKIGEVKENLPEYRKMYREARE